MAINSEIIAALREAREARGLSQRALAGRVGIPQSHLSKIEGGSVDLQLSSLTEIARVLELEIMLVPRKALPAIESIIRQTGPVTARDQQARAQQALREAAVLAERLAPHDRSQALYAISEAAGFLQHLELPQADLPTVHKAVEALQPLTKVNLDNDPEHETELILSAPRTVNALKKAARTLQALRNRAAHASATSRPARPAYGLDEEDDHG